MPIDRRFAAARSAIPATSASVAPSAASGASHLVQEEDAGDAAPAGLHALRGRGHVVRPEHRPYLDALVGRQLGREVEVQDVAAVIAVDVEDAACGVDGLGHEEHLLGARRLEDAADRGAVEQPLADIAHEQRQVPGPAARGDRDLAGLRGRRPDDRPRIACRSKVGRVGGKDAFEHLVHETFGVVDDLAHRSLPWPGSVWPGLVDPDGFVRSRGYHRVPVPREPMTAVPLAIDVRGIRRVYPAKPTGRRARRRGSRGPTGRVLRVARAKRRRQDHAHQDPHDAPAADRRPRRASSASTSPARRRRSAGS